MSGGFLQKGATNASAPPRPDVARGLALGVFAHGLQVCGWRSGVLQVCGLKHHGPDKFLGLPCFYLINKGEDVAHHIHIKGKVKKRHTNMSTPFFLSKHVK